MKGIICQGDSATDAGKPDVLIEVKRSNRTIEERTCTKSHKGREAETGRVRSLIVLGMLGVLAAAFYGVVTGYRLEFQGRVVAKRVALYQDWEGMLDPAAKVVGYVEPGTVWAVPGRREIHTELPRQVWRHDRLDGARLLV